MYKNIFSKNDLITTDKYLEAFPDFYYKTDVIFHNKSINFRGKKVNPPNKNLNLIISGHSDYSIIDNHVAYYNPKTWYTVNNETSSSNVISLPLGITNNTNESRVHSIYGNLDCMIQVINENIDLKNLVYMNFTISTYSSERKLVWNLFKDKDWVTIGKIITTIDGRITFLRQIKQHSFVLCPRGNGIDTHRLWETLYMGSIPIVRNNSALDEFKDLPICFIDNWNDITYDFLQEELKRINNIKWNLDKLKISYWINRINNSL